MAHASIRHEWKFLYIMFLKALFIVISCKWFHCAVYRLHCTMNNNESIIESVSTSLCDVAIPVISMLTVHWHKLESYTWWLVFSIDRDQYQLGTLSHILNNKTTGYKDLPEWPEEAPDPSVRNVEIPVPEVTTKKSERKKATKDKSFYSESESSSEGIKLIMVFEKTE